MNHARAGFHVSIAGGISNSVDNALKSGCNAFQIFSRNPRGWAVKPIEEEEAKRFKVKLAESKIQRNSVCVHMPYLPNLSSPNYALYYKSIDSLADEIKRCSMLGIPYLVIHLGSHLGEGSDNGISQVVKACSFAFDRDYKSSSNQNGNSVTILFENSAGQKNIIGLKELKMVHLNDSKDKINSNRDRHEHIGFGNIGIEGFRSLLKHKVIMRLPLIMETPDDDKCDDLKIILDLIGKQ